MIVRDTTKMSQSNHAGHGLETYPLRFLTAEALDEGQHISVR